ncbi:MAG TPA: SOS response-associated peptidase [Syntrophales bacterium]|nr:SOS response-associated peptidase [Syntrophobacterales bacterium]HNQ00856.1 SOS response-associated peptidase [Syntrophales bacterium]HQL91566.1 SOS response-associated peptidase [Syntrophales bacterium]
MCGRFTLVSPFAVVTERFGAAAPAGLRPRYNIAPGQDILCVVADGARRIEPMRWGLIPFWAKDPSIGNRLINARAETLAVKPSFRGAFAKRRCLIAADGFYEWRRAGRRKVPVYLFLRSGKPFGFAGLYEVWKAPDGREIRTCTIVTTGANDLVRPIHDRMPVIVPAALEDRWLDCAERDRGLLESVLTPYPAGEMDAYEVTTAVNDAAHDGPDCILPA